MKKILCLGSVLVLLTLFSAVPVNAGEAERTAALANLTVAETLVYIGNNGTIEMEDEDPNPSIGDAAHPSILYRIVDAKLKNDNSLIGSSDELLSELEALDVAISGLISEDDDFSLIQTESENLTGFTFLDRLLILKTKMDMIAAEVPFCGINNETQQQVVLDRVNGVVLELNTLILQFFSHLP